MKKAFSVLLLIGLLTALALGLLVFDVYSYDTVATDVEADAAIVLGAAIDGDKPSPVLRERVNHAVDLLRDGKVRWIIFTGGYPEDSEHAEAQVALHYAMTQGAPAEKLLHETKSHTTYQNLYYARELAGDYSIRSLVVVSDPHHLRRAMRMATSLEMNAVPSGTPTSQLNNFDFLFRESMRNAKYVVYHRVVSDAHANEMAVDRH